MTAGERVCPVLLLRSPDTQEEGEVGPESQLPPDPLFLIASQIWPTDLSLNPCQTF